MKAKKLLSTFEEELIALTQNAQQIRTSKLSVERPPLSISPKDDDISFIQLDAEEADFNGSSCVRFFGVTKKGNSIMCNVTGFLHYLYVPISDNNFRKDHIQSLINHLHNSGFDDVQKIEIHLKESVWSYNDNQKTQFLKIVVSHAKTVAKLRGAFERGQIQFQNYFPGTTMTYDNISYTLRMMVDSKITGMSWLTLPKETYILITNQSQKVTTCQIECHIHYKNLIAHPSEGEWAKIPPLRILSFDIECSNRKGIFSTAEYDSVIQIANVVSRFGENVPFVNTVFTLNTCSPIVGCDVISNKTEQQMLRAWRDFVVKVDPDIIIGYNTQNFDIPYLLNRATALGVTDFPYFGRLRHQKQEVKNSTFSSRAYGTKENKVTNIGGRIQFDLYQYFQREVKMRSYKLNNVSAVFLGEQKEDVHHSIITDLQNGDSETRRRLAVYCLKDAMLPMRLLQKMMCIVNYTEMARVTGVPFSFLLSRGQQIKVLSQLFRKALEHDIVIPNFSSSGGNEETYEGATVIEPVRGFHEDPVATLDFSSLYPSIIISHNLCYTTLVTQQTINSLGLKEGKDYYKTPNGDCFIKEHLKKGILPTILDELLSARKRAKAALKKESNPFIKDVLNGRQLALKISANSVYGFTGATNGKLPCLAISSSTTAIGREMIEATKNEIEEHFCKENNFPADAQVIYGDTDSVMVKFGLDDLKQCMELGQQAADWINEKLFKAPIRIEFEKVYYPYLLINKKRYAGLYWTKLDKYDKIDTKGIETVRRDNCKLVANVMTKILEMILIQRDVKAAEEFVKKIIADLLQDKVDLSELVITKTLAPEYAGKQAHAELAKRMRERDPGSAPSVGDRVAYVIIRSSSTKAFEKSEDPLYVLKNGLAIDSNYYLQNQLSKPLMRIFEPIMGENKAKQLLTGAHTRKVTMSKIGGPNRGLGGLMRFTKKVNTCKVCKSPCDGPVCENCEDKGNQIFAEQVAQLNLYESKFSKLWTQCQRCQGSLTHKVICSNNDCSIFYMREKCAIDIQNTIDDLAKW
ncbi:DNA-directed DNA polymerase delta POL3 [Ascoidea rubescens DSM 1968]|uniref:DNA polymerase n=1 Tax=Ascoidea rubescens DSM 1968 TaxID=1344418 RepID=A0A1D2V9Q1_9ASCO|nr:catalytic subunit of DNA polymerase delta [Ascoidea rubescens DSM 1968]ODV58381.1 catalytic subunit of DNA polymerase delta [Ascoidea rubescens DSM 1968]